MIIPGQLGTRRGAVWPPVRMTARPPAPARPLPSRMAPFAPLPEAARRTRGHVRATLASWGLGEYTDQAEIVTGELVANAVQASAAAQASGEAPGISVSLTAREHSLLIEVWDRAPGVPVLRAAGSSDESGRGLAIVNDLTDGRWGSHPGVSGRTKCVWAELLAAPPAAPNRRTYPAHSYGHPNAEPKGIDMTITHENPAPARLTNNPLHSLWVEVTGMCQLPCVHCYAGSGPDGTHGIMTAGNWEKVLTDAAGLGTLAVCFIGGEPILHPDLPQLVRHALALGMEAEVFSNLVHVTPGLWELFGTPGVRLATSWYTNDRLEHKQITGRDTHRQTLASIEEAVRRDIPLRVGLIDGILPGQHTEDGAELLRARGVTDIGGDHLREFGRGTNPDPSQACGNCGHHRAAVLPDGTVTPCPLTRWMHAGNVTSTPLADILDTVTQMADTLPAQVRACQPGVCLPDAAEPCPPNCRPSDSTMQSRNTVRACNPDCVPDSYCNPLCIPGACKPRI
jgi:MoaA/NifB/PqqE/SkfB family radical SAM enzyme/anti-sigma regulatory factor (Ser/Thr protein kinase)